MVGSKKAASTLMIVFEVLLVLFVTYSYLQIAERYASSETTNKINIAEDIKMMIDTLVGTPGEATVQYPANASKYSFILSANSITVFIKGEGEQKAITRHFFLPAGYTAFGAVEGKETLCLEKEKRRILLRECAQKEAEQALPELLPGEPNFYGIPITGDRIVFVIDRSSSMEVPSEWEFSEFELPEGKKIASRFDVAVWQFRKALQDLPDGKYFTAVLFNDKITDETAFYTEFVELNTKNREKASAFVGTLKPYGGTNLFDPLKLALAYENVDTIFLITDGFPSVGLTNHDTLLSEVQKLNVHNAKINTVGTFILTGGEGSTARVDKEKGEKLLRALAEQNEGVFVMRVKESG